MLRLIDRGLAVICVAAAALVVVLLFAGPDLIGAKKSSASSSQQSSGGTSTSQGSGSGAAKVSGAAVFSSAGCGGCHTLKAAGTTGSVGPNLDDLKPSASAVSGIVRSGGGGMPSFSGKLSDAQIAAVASYVSSVAGQ
jgi:mono/diheme cytochrome c family protein